MENNDGLLETRVVILEHVAWKNVPPYVTKTRKTLNAQFDSSF